jgi:mRNA interferase MazF
MTIKQGDIYWADLAAPRGSEPVYRHPFVVIQNNVFNVSRISTVIVCAVTSNLKLAQAPGNVILHKGEANLEKRSVVNISQVATINKSDLTEKIGSLSAEKITKIIDGIKLLIDPLPDPRL